MTAPKLSDLDDDFEASGAAWVATADWLAALPAPHLSSGTFTLTFPDGSHKTFRVRVEKNGPFAGKRTLALLIGPDNCHCFENVAFVTGTGFAVWKRYASGKVEWFEKLPVNAAKLWALAKGVAIEGHELLVSAKCKVCSRPLTDAESIRTEIGPTCRKRVGMQ